MNVQKQASGYGASMREGSRVAALALLLLQQYFPNVNTVDVSCLTVFLLHRCKLQVHAYQA